MPLPEAEHTHPEPQQQQEVDQHNELFCLAARFRAERPSRRVYFKAQDVIFRKPDSELSVYRFQLNQIFHVAVLGAPPDQTLEQRLRRLLAAGDPVTLPENIITMLVARRVDASREGSWIERHYRRSNQ